MKVLITGGAGFVGQHLARRLAGAHDLTALDLLHPQVHLDPDGAKAAFPGTVVVGDVADPADWATLPRADLVVHLAAETGTAQSMYEQDRYTAVNVGGTRLAGQMARRWGAPLVSLSSRAVYGEGRYRTPSGEVTYGVPPAGSLPEPSQEDDPHVPVSVYGTTKSRGEAAVADIADDIPVTILRPQNVVGPGQALHNPYTGVLAAWLARLREGRPLLVYGDGHQTRDMVHVGDLAALIEWCLANPAPLGAPRVLNCGTGVRTTLTELAGYAIEGSPSRTGHIEHVEIHRAGDIDHACASLARLAEVGAPQPTCSTRDAVVDFIAWSWDRPGAKSQAWDDALDELATRGLTS